MGCTHSKSAEEDPSPLVSLCRARRDLIAAAAGHRYSLADAHAAYFSSVSRVGDALHRFVVDELTAAPPSPVLTLPPSNSKSKSKSDGSVPAGSSTSSISLSTDSSSDDCSHLHLHHDDDDDEVAGSDPDSGTGSHLHFPSRSGSDRSFHGGAQPNPSFYYMKSSAPPPATIYVDPAAGRYEYQSLGQDYQHYYYDYFYDDDPPPPPRENPAPAAAAAQPPTTPPPPAPDVSAWDFFNPFESYQQEGFPAEYIHSERSFRSGSGSASSPDSSEIRKKEGIPDLEEETEAEIEKEAQAAEKSSKVAAPQQEVVGETAPVAEEENAGPIHVREKAVSFEEDMGSIRTEESRSGSTLSTVESRSGSGPLLHVHETRDVVEAVEDIKEKFKSIAGCGEEVSRLLEVGKVRYPPRNGLLRVILSRILDFMAQSMVVASCTNPSNANMPKPNGVTTADPVFVSVKSDNLSSTLDKLYVWEKRLYKEVKDEEKLRVFYEKECRRLRALDDGGAESHMIDSTRAAIRRLLTKISMSIRSIEAISSRIHKIRDEELRPQLIQLIQGLVTMWKAMLDCHQNQFQAIMDSKSQYLSARSKMDGNSVAKATMELELELLNWCSCFRNWTNTQKAYIESLNGWLMKWLLHEQEETPDGFAPFSPGRIGAPAVFVILNDWQHAVERISGVGVMTALQSLAASIHRLWESQGEEQRQKLKAEYLARDLSRRLRTLQKENEIQGHLDRRTLPILNNETNHNDHAMALETMKKRLEEERAKHHEIVKQVQDFASSSLQQGLAPVFEALGSYTLETLKAYEELRIQIGVEGG